ncbi:MAG TPA: tetratricopeptide repeat protein [Saprospiraceae bacterium]|nr:tetratricopeptide repeat protein [Saprospiraceae bacterium]
MTLVNPSFLNRILFDGKWHLIILFSFTFLLYANTLGHEFALDDGIVIKENKHVKKGISGIPEIFSKHSFHGFFKKSGKEKVVAGGRYRPMTLAFFACIYEIFGEDPAIYHFFSIAVYALLGIVIYQVLKKLFEKILLDKAVPFAFFSAFIFIAHPVHTECIANIKGMDETASLLFSLIALWFSLEFIDRKKYLRLLFASLAFMTALLSKENAIAYLAIIPIACYLLYAKDWKLLIPVFVTLLITAFVFLVIRGSILGFNPFGSVSKELMNNPYLSYKNGENIPMALAEKIGLISYSLFEYIRLLLVPHPLTHDYYPKQIPVLGPYSIQSVLAYFIYSGLIIFAFLKFRKSPIASFSIACYLLPLVLVSNIFFPIGTNLGERFIFMSSLGFCIFVSFLLIRFFSKNGSHALYVLTPLLILYSIKTITRNPVWHDNATLFKSDIKISTQSAKLHNGLAGIYLERVRDSKDTLEVKQALIEAKKEAERAIEINPLYMEAHLQLGNSYYYSKNFEKAIEEYNFILQRTPEDEDAFKNLQYSLRERGRQIGLQNGDVAKAKDLIKKSLGMNPDDLEALMLMGIAEGSEGNTDNALYYFNQVLKKDPKNAQAYFNLGIAYRNVDQIIKSDSMFNKAVQLDSSIYIKNGQFKK